MWTIENKQTREVADLSRTMTTKPPDWVHEQCGTTSESELELHLDQLSSADYEGLGRDSCGIGWDDELIQSDGPTPGHAGKGPTTMTTATTTHEPGTADFVTEITFTRMARRFGFTAYLIDEGDCGAVYLSAIAWRGQQPRLCLHKFDKGHKDWVNLLMKLPETKGVMRFVGAATASRMPYDQWLTQGPSPLLV
jgi:hypothetical protein